MKLTSLLDIKNDKRKYMKMSDITSMVKDVEKTLAPYFKEIEEIAYSNQEKVLNAFHYVKATESDLVGSTGYGYDDFGRDHLEEIYAHTFKVKMLLCARKSFLVHMRLL